MLLVCVCVQFILFYFIFFFFFFFLLYILLTFSFAHFSHTISCIYKLPLRFTQHITFAFPLFCFSSSPVWLCRNVVKVIHSFIFLVLSDLFFFFFFFISFLFFSFLFSFSSLFHHHHHHRHLRRLTSSPQAVPK